MALISSLRWVEAMLSPAAHGVWRSLVARFVRDEEVVGSNPATPTKEEAHELAHEVFEEEGVRGRQAEYPDQEVIAQTHVMESP